MPRECVVGVAFHVLSSLFQQLNELFATNPGRLQDCEQKTWLEIAVMDRNSDRVPKLVVSQGSGGCRACGATASPSSLEPE